MFPHDHTDTLSNTDAYDPYFEGFMFNPMMDASNVSHSMSQDMTGMGLGGMNTLGGMGMGTMSDMGMTMGGMNAMNSMSNSSAMNNMSMVYNNRARNLNGQFLGKTESRSGPKARVGGRRRNRRHTPSVARPRDRRGRFISSDAPPKPFSHMGEDQEEVHGMAVYATE